MLLKKTISGGKSKETKNKSGEKKQGKNKKATTKKANDDASSEIPSHQENRASNRVKRQEKLHAQSCSMKPKHDLIESDKDEDT